MHASQDWPLEPPEPSLHQLKVSVPVIWNVLFGSPAEATQEDLDRGRGALEAQIVQDLRLHGDNLCSRVAILRDEAELLNLQHA